MLRGILRMSICICARVYGGSMARYEHVAGQYTRAACEGAKAVLKLKRRPSCVERLWS